MGKAKAKYRIAMTMDDYPERYILLAKEAGEENKPTLSADGQILIKDTKGIVCIEIRSTIKRKKSTPHDAPDPERDAFAQRVVDALNAANVLPPKQEEA